MPYLVVINRKKFSCIYLCPEGGQKYKKLYPYAAKTKNGERNATRSHAAFFDKSSHVEKMARVLHIFQ